MSVRKERDYSEYRCLGCGKIATKRELLELNEEKWHCYLECTCGGTKFEKVKPIRFFKEY
jgi:hypothetical protein